MDREAWHAAVHGVAKSWTQLSDWTELNWMDSDFPTTTSIRYRAMVRAESPGDLAEAMQLTMATLAWNLRNQWEEIRVCRKGVKGMFRCIAETMKGRSDTEDPASTHTHTHTHTGLWTWPDIKDIHRQEAIKTASSMVTGPDPHQPDQRLHWGPIVRQTHNSHVNRENNVELLTRHKVVS